MVEIRKIPVENILNDSNFDYICSKYADESKIKFMPNIKPDHDYYVELEEKGMLKSIGVYSDDSLVGIATFLVFPIPHYSAIGATIESLFILKEHRHHGTGIKLNEFIYNYAKESGAVSIFMSAPIDGSLNRVAESFGFTKTNITYTREIS